MSNANLFLLFCGKLGGFVCFFTLYKCRNYHSCWDFIKSVPKTFFWRVLSSFYAIPSEGIVNLWDLSFGRTADVCGVAGCFESCSCIPLFESLKDLSGIFNLKIVIIRRVAPKKGAIFFALKLFQCVEWLEKDLQDGSRPRGDFSFIPVMPRFAEIWKIALDTYHLFA